MSGAAVIGDSPDLWGFALAGVAVFPAATDDAARAAWHALPPGTALVILGSAAAEALATERATAGAPLSVVAPA